MLTPEELKRYSRHLLIPGLGIEGQQKLKAARVLVIGCGGLGSPILLYLAAAGVGTLGIVDGDRVDDSNLQRQIMYGSESVGKSKVEETQRRLESLNSFVKVNPYFEIIFLRAIWSTMLVCFLTSLWFTVLFTVLKGR